MADISSYIRLIELAARGEEVRDALIDSLTAINSGIPDTVDALLVAAMARGDFIGPQGPKGDPPDLTYDAVPTANSANLLTSGAVYSALDSITPGVSLTESAYLALTENEKNNGTVYYLSDKRVIYRNGVAYGLPTSWNDVTGKPTSLTGYGVAVDSTPMGNSTNPVTSGGIYNAVLAKENTSNKKTEITAASTDTDYPSAKAVWSLFFSMQEEITRLKARVTALENGDTPSAAVENNILEVYDGEMNGTVLEVEGAYVDEENILNFGTGPSSGLSVENNILEVDGTMNGTVLELNGASVDESNNLSEERGGSSTAMNNGILSLGNVSVTGNILEVDGVMDGTTMNL